MKRIVLVLLFFAAVSSAIWTNEATGDMLDARYDYVACNVDYAEEWLAMREACGDSNNVTVFDSSDYVSDLKENLVELREAADEGDSVEFGLITLQMGSDTVKVLGELVKDALTGKTLSFFTCVRQDEDPLKEELQTCHASAREKEKDAAKQYLGNEIEYANDQIDEMKELGAETSGMEAVVQYGNELMDDIDGAFATGETTEISNLYLRHSRLVLLFRLEKMVSVIDYAEPIVEDGNNKNKDEILERGRELREDTTDLISECEYSADVSNNMAYGADNLSCWADGLVLFNEFNQIQVQILEGVFK